MEINIRKQDELLMSLVHYFVTKENYSPILVQGVKDEVWLENLNGPYRIIRINTNYIHNEEQYKYDQFKIKNILAQIKKKTLSFSVNALNINLNINDDVDSKSVKNIDNLKFKTLEEINNSDLSSIFPTIKTDLVKNTGSLDLILNVTKDINEKTQRENKRYESLFSYKKPTMTYILIALCILMFIVELIISRAKLDIYSLLLLGANYKVLLQNFEVHRLISYMFLHASFIHLITNMYSLYIIGNTIESKFGRVKYLIIYLVSGIIGGLLSAGSGNVVSVGASGAIFGLLGAICYFGYVYRLYFKETLKRSIIPVIIINLGIGLFVSGIDIWCHIGGLIGGFLCAMIVGISETPNRKDRINGSVLLTIFTLFLIYLVYFR